MEDIFKDSNTIITPELNEFYSNSFLVKGIPANENVLPTPQVGGGDDKTGEIKSLINKLNNISDVSKSSISNIQSKYTDPLADAKMFAFNPTYKGLNWDRYKSHSSFDELGFDPFRDNEKLYNDNSSIWSDFTRGVQGFGKITAGAFINTAADLPKLLTGDWAPNTEAAKETERIMAETMSTRGTFGSSVINFGINAGFTVGIIGELITEEILLGAVGLGGAAETGGASLGAAGYLAAVRAGMAGSKIMGLGKTTGALLKAIKNLDNVVEAKQYFTQFGRGTAQFLNPLQATTDLVRNWDNIKGLGQVAKASKSFGAFFKDIRDINRSFSEAKLEGGFVQNAMFENLLSEAYANGKTPTPEDIDKIKETSLTAGYMNQMINFPVIQYTNNITFGGLTRPLNKLIGATEDSVRMLNKTVTADLSRKQIFQELAGGWRESFKRGLNPRLMAKNTLNYFSANISEGLQESFQEASSIAMEDYYTKKYHNENSIVRNQYELSMLDSYGKGIGAQFSGQGVETFLSGFLMGGLMHRGGKLAKGIGRGLSTGLNESSNKVKDLFYSYTKPNELQDIRDKREARKVAKEEQAKKYDQFRSELINNLNDFYSDSGKMLTRDLAHMSAQEILDARAKQAQETGDTKFLIDFTDTSLYENVQNALYFGKFDLYLEHLDKIKALDDQGLMEAMGIDNAQAGRQRLEVAIERANNIKQRSEKFAKNPFNFNDYQKDTEEYNEMQYMHHAYEDAKNAAIFTPYQFDRVLSRMSSITNDFSSIDIVANGNATEFLHLFGEENIANEAKILYDEIASLKDGTKENEALAKKKEKQIEGLTEIRNAIIAHRGYFKALAENEAVDPQYEKNLRDAFVNYLGEYANIKSDILKSDKLDDAFNLFNDYYRLNIDAEYLSRSVAVVADPDFLRRDSLRRYEAIKNAHVNRKKAIERKVDVYLKKIGLNGVFQNLYDAGYVGEPEQMVAYNLSGGKKPVTVFYRVKDLSRVTAADTADIAKINEIFNDYEDLTGITKEKEEAAKKAAEAAAKKVEEDAEAARVAEKAKALDNFTPETKAKLVAAYDKYERKDIETFEEYIESAPEAKRIIAAEKQPAPVPAPIITPAPATSTSDIEKRRNALPDSQVNTRSPATQIVLDYFAEVVGIPKFIENLDKGTYIGWLRGTNNLGDTLTLLLEQPKRAFDEITKYSEEIAALKSKATPAPTLQVQTIEEIKNDIAVLRAKEQAEYAAMSDPNDTVARKKIYDAYDVLITPLLKEAKADIKERRDKDINSIATDPIKEPSEYNAYVSKINAKYDAELESLKKKEKEPEVKEAFPLSPQFEGKIIYFSPGLGKTTLVNQYPDQFIDMDALLYEEFKDEPGFENATPDSFGSVISAIYKSLKNDQQAFDAFDAIKNKLYDNAFKKAQALAKQGKTVLTGSGAFIYKADFSIKANDENISKEQLKNKTPGIDQTDLATALSSVKRNENKNNILMSVDKDSFTEFLMGNYDLLQYIEQDINLAQLTELGKYITSNSPQEVREAYNKKAEYLQARELLFSSLQPGDTVIILNEKTGKTVTAKIMKKRDADTYDLEYDSELESSYLRRNRLNTLINIIPVQGESEMIKVDDLDNANAEDNKTKVNDIATETERLKALLNETFNDDDLFEDSEDPNNCKTK